MQDSGIKSTSHNVLPSTQWADINASDKHVLPDQHNASTSNVGVCYILDLKESATHTFAVKAGTSVHQQTCTPLANHGSYQTVPPTHRKSQALNINNCYHSVQTSHAGTLSESIDRFSNNTMTPVVECSDTSTLTHTMEVRHSQTTKIDEADKTTGVERRSFMNPPNHNCIPPNCKSARIHTYCPLSYVRKSDIQGKPVSGVWIHSAADLFMDNNSALLAMTEFLDSLQQVCADGDNSVT